MATQHSTRTRELHKLILREALDALVITSPADWFYLTGFTTRAKEPILLLHDSHASEFLASLHYESAIRYQC